MEESIIQPKKKKKAMEESKARSSLKADWLP